MTLKTRISSPTFRPLRLVVALGVLAVASAAFATSATAEGIARPAPPGASNQVTKVRLTARPWAKVSIDGKAAGTTPLTVALAPGNHTLVFTRSEQTVTRTVTVIAGKPMTVAVDFTKPQPPAPAPQHWVKVSLKARPWARISVDGTDIGTTPKAIELIPGTYTIEFRRKSKLVTRKLVVKAGDKPIEIIEDLGD